MSSLSWNVWQVLRQSQEDENSTKYDQILIRSKDPLMIIPKSLSKMHGKCMYGQSKARIGWDFNEVWPKVNQVCGIPNKYFHQVWGQSHDRYLQKCTETKYITDEGMNVRQFKDI